MPTSPDLVWQPSLLSLGERVGIDPTFSKLKRVHLDEESWVDVAPGWVSGADRLFEELVAGRAWEQRSRRMYDRRVDEPRLTSTWRAASGDPLEPPVLEEIRIAL